MIKKGGQLGIEKNKIICVSFEDQTENKFYLILICLIKKLRENYIDIKKIL